MGGGLRFSLRRVSDLNAELAAESFVGTKGDCRRGESSFDSPSRGLRVAQDFGCGLRRRRDASASTRFASATLLRITGKETPGNFYVSSSL